MDKHNLDLKGIIISSETFDLRCYTTGGVQLDLIKIGVQIGGL